MAKVRSWWQQPTQWLLKSTGLFFPSLSELQLAMVGASLITFFFYHLFNAPPDNQGDRSFIIAFIAMAGIGFLLLKQKLSLKSKTMISVLYYLFFAAMAANAISSQLLHSAEFSLAFVNYWLMIIVLILAVARGLVALVLARIQSPFTKRLVAQNFRGTQYRPVAFLIAGLATMVLVVVLYGPYPNPALCIPISLTYAYTFMMVVELVLPAQRLVYTR